jgi:hypothetical protein
VIRQAPWSIAAIAIACLGIGWVVGRFLGSERIRNLLSRVERRDDEIAELKRKLAELPNSPDRKALRVAISEFIAKGENLQAKCRIEGLDDLPVQQIDEWVNEIQTILSEKLDQSYVRRLLNDAGLSSVIPVGNLTKEQRNSWRWVHHRTERLNQFLSELS